VKCYDFGKTGHMSWEFPDKKKEGGGKFHIFEEHKRNVEEKEVEEGRSLMMRKVLVKPKKEEKEPVQRNNLFMTSCKTKDWVLVSTSLFFFLDHMIY